MKLPLGKLASTLALLALLGCAENRLHLDPSGEHVFIYDPPPAAVATCPPGTVPTAVPAPTPAPVLAPSPVAVAPPPVSGLQPIAAQPVAMPAAAAPVSPYSDAAVTLAPDVRVVPVGAEVILVAGVLGGDGYLRTNRRLDWYMAPNSAGQFTEIGKGHFEDILVGDFTSPRVVSNVSAIGTTSRIEEHVGQGGSVPILRGESWIALRSATEGISQVTVAAPSVVVPAARAKTATIYWYDAQYTLPEPVVAPPGGKGTLTATVWKLTSRCPLAGWTVRYELTGGPQAIFVPSGSTAVEVPTDSAGRASVEIVQREPSPGTSQIRVQLFHPAEQCSPRFLVRDAVTAVSWTSCAVGGPTQAIPSPAPALPGPVTTTPPANVAPPVTVGPPGTPTTPAPAMRPAPATPSLLDLKVTPRSAAVVGSMAIFDIAVTNRGANPAQGVELHDAFDPGLELTARSPVRIVIGDLAPGETRQQPIEFRVMRAGRLCQRVEVVATDGGRAAQDVCVNASEPQPSATNPPATNPPATNPPVTNPPAPPVTPPNAPNATPPPITPAAMPLEIHASAQVATASVGQAVVFTATIQNVTRQPVENVTLVAQADATLKVLQVTDEAKTRGSEYVWNLPAIPAGRTVTLQVQCQGGQAADKACCRFIATLANGQATQAEACLQITAGNPLRAPASGAPAASKLAVRVDNRNIVSAGKVQQFVVQVSNEGDASESDIVVTAHLPPGTTLAPDGTAGPAPTITFQQQSGDVLFSPYPELPAGRMMTYRVNVTTSQSGQITLQADAASRNQPQPASGSATVEVLPAE